MKVVGEMEDVLIRLSTNEKICQYIDIVVAYIPDCYGLILNQHWSVRLNGCFASDWSHLWFPKKGSPNQIKILREPYMKHNVTRLGEGNESADSVLGNYLIELKIRHLTEIKANSKINYEPELLQLPQDDEDECRIADMCSISKIAKLDHG